MYSKNKYLFLLCIILLYSCANIVTPQGGPKDTTPPSAISSNPKDSSLNFTGNKIVITFSENIQLKDAQKNIAISPSLKNGGFVVESDKKNLLIKLKYLQPNTTYTINARNSIADITESNTLKNFKYVFSTGDVIDSLKFKGTVIKSSTLEPCKNVMVGLYKTFNDSNIFKIDPDYFSITDDKGNFEIENIKAGSYRLVSIDDKNNNKRWEAGEELGFLNDTIVIDSNKKHVIVRQFKQMVSKDHLISAKSNNKGIYEFEFDNDSVVTINQEDPSLDKTRSYYQRSLNDYCYNDIPKTYVISSLNPKDSAHFNYTINNILYKTAVRVPNVPVSLTTQYPVYSFINSEPINLSFLRAIDTNTFKRNKFTLMADTSSLKNTFIRFSSTYQLSLGKLDKGIYKLIFHKGAITDVSGVENDSFQVIIKVLDKDDLQSLILKTDSSFKKTYRLRLVKGEDYCNNSTIISNTTYSFTDLIPGNYKIIVYDNAKNNVRFIHGDYFTHTLPEKLVYYKEIEIKPSFDVEEILSVMYK